VNVPFLDLAAQLESIRPELDAAIGEVLDEGTFVAGERVERFERQFARYCGVGHCVGVASGTDAIELGLRALGIGAGDEVITVANTCIPTVAGIEAAGAAPVLVDADPATMTLDPARVGAVISARTRAIVPVHLYGRCADMTPILQLARDHGLKVLEDAAQAHGAELDGRRSGSLGDAAAFSFYPTKNLGGIGDGGAVVTDTAAVAERVRLLRSYGEDERYHSVLRGRNSRLDSLQAAVLSVKLTHLDGANTRRRELAGMLQEELVGKVGLQTASPGHVYHLFVVRSRRRDRLRDALAREGIASLVHYPRAVHQHPAYRHLAHDGLAVSEALASEVVSLPCRPDLADDDVRAVAAAVRRSADAGG
jgi:dTDP-4-amino-4,6-dideoxygalactose transaminase